MNELTVIGCALALSGCACLQPCCKDDAVVGNWGLKLPYPDMNAGHMIVNRAADGTAQAVILWRWASPIPMTSCEIRGNRFCIVHPWNMILEGCVDGDALKGTVTYLKKDGTVDEKQPKGEFTGWRNPPIEPAHTALAKLGEPIDLLKDGLDGWKSMNEKAKFGWSFKDGVLSNRIKRDAAGKRVGGDVNLISKRADFFDFNLSYDVCVPKGCNSGVYLRGRYEIQTIDSYGQPVDRHNMAAFYGRITPRVAAEKPAGEWQHVDAMLYKRHVTVVLNGVNIIDNQPVLGCTGGAITSDEFVKGPIYLQGDHSDADFRNIHITPIVK